MFTSDSGFVTNNKYFVERTLQRKQRSYDRRVYSGQPMIKGPVYANRTEETEKDGFLKKIGAFFTTAGAAIAAVFKSSDASAKQENEEIRAPERKSTVKVVSKATATPAAKIETPEEEPIPSILDIKFEAESKARKQIEKEEKTNGLIKKIKSYAPFFPETGAYKYIALDELDSLSDNELEELLEDIESQIWETNCPKNGFNKVAWNNTEEYLLFEGEIKIGEFIDLLDASGNDIASHEEIIEFVHWRDFKNGKTADFRYGNDVVHNANITNLKNTIYHAYLAACEDGGKLDHNPILEFPNGTKVKLSKFIGKDRFNEIAEPGAEGKILKKLQTQELKSA